MKYTSQNITEVIASKVDHNFDWTYFNFHIDRYIILLDFTHDFLKSHSENSSIQVLDVGPSFQTVLLRHFYPEITIDTLGFKHTQNNLRDSERHIHKDLNLTLENPNPEVENQYDLIFCCEVMEHIYTNPLHMLNFLRRMLNPKGTLYLQTPNAVAIHKRIKMLFGRNPFPKLEDNRQGHFREYTGREVKDLLTRSNLYCTSHQYRNHFGLNANIWHRCFKKLNFLLPKTLRDGMTILAKK